MNGTIKNKYTAFALFVVLFLVIWSVLDFLFNTIITKSGYQFSPVIDLCIPVVVSVTIGYLLFLRKKNNDK